jgi:hypothetical protein
MSTPQQQYTAGLQPQSGADPYQQRDYELQTMFLDLEDILLRNQRPWLMTSSVAPCILSTPSLNRSIPRIRIPQQRHHSSSLLSNNGQLRLKFLQVGYSITEDHHQHRLMGHLLYTPQCRLPTSQTSIRQQARIWRCSRLTIRVVSNSRRIFHPVEVSCIRKAAIQGD